MKDIVIAGYARSPFHFATKGALTKVRPDDLAAHVVKGLMERTGVNPEDVEDLIEDLILGCAFPEGEQGFNMARLVGLMAGLPISVAGTTVNRFCGSSMQAILIRCLTLHCARACQRPICPWAKRLKMSAGNMPSVARSKRCSRSPASTKPEKHKPKDCLPMKSSLLRSEDTPLKKTAAFVPLPILKGSPD